ncbi:MAG: proliferating cell nuclear antigen (pcna) [Candidatus Nitrosocaldaceae archaeon]
MKALSNSPEGWKAVINAVSTLVEEATFEASSEGISFRGMDPSHVALINIQWPNVGFESYESDNEIRFAVRIEELSKLLKRAEKNDKVEVSIDEDMLVLHIYNGYDKKYKLHLIDATTSTTPLPKLSFNSKIRLSMNAFKDVLDDIEPIADYIVIDANKDRVIFSGKGDSGDASITLHSKKDNTLSIETKEDSVAKYSLEYLSRIVKSIGSSANDLTIEFATSMPIKLEFTVMQSVKIDFYLAPRVDS